MSVLIDSYNEVPYSGDTIMATGRYVGIGQSFTVGLSRTLDSCKFSIKKWLGKSPSGDMVAKVYAHTGTYGTSSLPTGSALATSTAVEASDQSTTLSFVEFLFSGVNRISLLADTKYVVVIEYSGVDGIIIELDASSPTHSGNSVLNDNGAGYIAYQYWDIAFEVYGETPTTPTVGSKYPLPAFKVA